MDEIQDKIMKFEEERGSLRKNVSKEYQNPAEITQQINSLKHKFETA
jgi:protein-arginine kinase activator protein McsA